MPVLAAGVLPIQCKEPHLSKKFLYHRVTRGHTEVLPYTRYFTGVEILDRCGNDPSAGSPTKIENKEKEKRFFVRNLIVDC